jgi:hypothetical protein
MSTQTTLTNYKEPRLSPGASEACVQTIVGIQNKQIDKNLSGNSGLQKTRVFSASTARLFDFLSVLSNAGFTRATELRDEKILEIIAASPELAPYGLRGEALQMLTLQPQITKEQPIIVQNQPQKTEVNQT